MGGDSVMALRLGPLSQGVANDARVDEEGRHAHQADADEESAIALALSMERGEISHCKA